MSFSPHHLSEIIWFLADFQTVSRLVFVSRRVKAVIDEFPVVLFEDFPEFTGGATRFQGSLDTLLTVPSAQFTDFALTIPADPDPCNEDGASEDEPLDVSEYAYRADDASGEKAQALLAAIAPIRDRVTELCAPGPTPCLASFRRFGGLRSLSLAYGMLDVVFPALRATGRAPSYFYRLPLARLALTSVPLPFPARLAALLAPLTTTAVVLSPAASPPLTASGAASFAGAFAAHTVYVTQPFSVKVLQHLPDNVVLHPDVVRYVADRLAGANKPWNGQFLERYFPAAVHTSDVDVVPAALVLRCENVLPTVVRPKLLRELHFHEHSQPPVAALDLTRFAALSVLSLRANALAPRTVVLPASLTALTCDTFAPSVATTGLTNLRVLSLYGATDAEMAFPRSLVALDLHWCRQCTALPNLPALTLLTACALVGVGVAALAFPPSLVSLRLCHCPNLSFVEDYDRIFQLAPDVVDCPQIVFG